MAKYSHTCPVWCSPFEHTEDDLDTYHYSTLTELEIVGAKFTAGLHRQDDNADSEPGGVQVWLQLKDSDGPQEATVCFPISSVLRVTDFLHGLFYRDEWQGMPALAELSDVA